MRRLSLLAAAITVAIAAASAAPARADVCDGDAEFKPGPANNFNSCRKLWEPIGTPRYANDDVDATPVCHTAYVLSHNNVNKTPDWVIERLNKSQFAGGEDRPKTKFQPEEFVCKAARALDNQYANSKMDRGHQAPSADFSSTVELMKESFILSNAVPQQGVGFNRHIWKEFEDLVRKLAQDRGEIFVITGPINRGDDEDEITIKADANPCKNEIKLEGPTGRTAICGKGNKCPEGEGVAIPVALYKIIYDAKNRRANAYVLPNIDHRKLDKSKDPLEYLKRYRVAVRTVEQFTGLQFLRAIPKRERKAQIEECVATMLH
jgi:DNA/RNA endonuclease G (NUC1)